MKTELIRRPMSEQYYFKFVDAPLYFQFVNDKNSNSGGISVYIMSTSGKTARIFYCRYTHIFCTLGIISSFTFGSKFNIDIHTKYIDYAICRIARRRNIVTYHNTQSSDTCLGYLMKSNIFIEGVSNNSHYGVDRQRIFNFTFNITKEVYDEDETISNRRYELPKQSSQDMYDAKRFKDNPVPSIDKDENKILDLIQYIKDLEDQSGIRNPKHIEYLESLINGVETNNENPVEDALSF